MKPISSFSVFRICFSLFYDQHERLTEIEFTIRLSDKGRWSGGFSTLPAENFQAEPMVW